MIGRKEEISVLEDLLTSKKPELLALYGRRRVGKTYLVKNFFNESFSFYATGIQNSNKTQQLRAFKESLVKYGDTSTKTPRDWFEAFSRLEKLLSGENVYKEYEHGKKIVFLDELPWMDTARSDFKSALDYFWNSWGSSQNDLVLIVCGSATSWIINNIVKDTGGFYNRVTRQIRLMPFNLGECEQFFAMNGIKWTRSQMIESYMVFGGIPYYLNYIKPQYSLSQNIQMLFFEENSPFKYEFQQLFKALFPKSDKYISIIRELAGSRSGLKRTELINSGKVAEGKELTRCLEDLEQCGFIRKYNDYTLEKNGCYYQLTDPFCLFYLRFMDDGRVESWADYIKTPAYFSWCGVAFEKVCLMHIKQVKHKLGISGVSANAYAWSSKKSKPGVQIDLLIDRKDDVINICEIKYSQEPFSISAEYERDLIHKTEVFRKESKTRKALWLTMITFSGLVINEHKNEVVCEITGDDLFAL